MVIKSASTGDLRVLAIYLHLPPQIVGTHMSLLRLAILALFATLSCTASVPKVPTVPASQGPAPPEGSGWKCYEYVARNDIPSSRCFRTDAECEVAISRVSMYAKSLVTDCRSHNQAHCSYSWFSDGRGRHECYRDDAACSRAQYGSWLASVATKATECAAYK